MAKIIWMTKGATCIVDDSDYERLNKSRWHASGLEFRAARRLRDNESHPQKMIFIYHEILGVLPWELDAEDLCVDHLNGDPNDNRKENLRIVTTKENMRNTKRSKEKLGISVDRTHNTFKAYYDSYDKPRVNIGTFKSREAAQKALDDYKAKLEIPE